MTIIKLLFFVNKLSRALSPFMFIFFFLCWHIKRFYIVVVVVFFFGMTTTRAKIECVGDGKVGTFSSIYLQRCKQHFSDSIELNVSPPLTISHSHFIVMFSHPFLCNVRPFFRLLKSTMKCTPLQSFSWKVFSCLTSDGRLSALLMEKQDSSFLFLSLSSCLDNGMKSCSVWRLNLS